MASDDPVLFEIRESHLNTGLRGGKGVPIYRPRFVARDQPERHLT